MKITLLCNAGLAIETADALLLVDAPNQEIEPFYRMPDDVWNCIQRREPPYDKTVGLFFTHNHPDHFDLDRVSAYHRQWPKTPILLPGEETSNGRVRMGPFVIGYGRIEHAPIPEAPPHVVAWVETGEGSIYLPGDAALKTELHREFLRGRKADVGIWNSMYLSNADTRSLMRDAAVRNFIYHMPVEKQDLYGLWRKLESNYRRYPDELQEITVLSSYPTEINISK